MWYFIWFLGVFLACSFSIITALTIENFDLLNHIKKEKKSVEVNHKFADETNCKILLEKKNKQE